MTLHHAITPLQPVPAEHPPSRRHLLAWAGLSALGLGLGGCERGVTVSPPGTFKNLDLTGADYANRFDLPDAAGQRRTLADFKGRLPVVFFGYTQCPDVCPATMAQLKEVQGLLGTDGDKLVAIFITLDPERDEAALLREYVGSFDPQWVALRGSLEETREVAKTFKVFYRKVEGKAPGAYTMDHTAASYVFDTQGRVRLYVRHNTPAADLAADLKTLLARAG